MKYAAALALALQGAIAFPSAMMSLVDDPNTNHFDPVEDAHNWAKREARGFGDFYISDEKIGIGKRATPAQTISKGRGNCGIQGPCLVFDAKEQYVSNTGEHAYASPAADEIRGPCPGLNAASNHAYLPRSGIASIPQTIDGLGQMFGMSVDLAGFLAAYAVIFDGDVITQTWSIGGPPPSSSLGSGILGKPQGISWSHNKYEGDTSIGRKDAYINNGDAHSLDIARFNRAYAVGLDNDRYTLDKFSQQYARNTYYSIYENPYYFAPLFSTTLVSPAAYNFVINFMSNHSAAEPSGYLNGKMFKQWFAVTGTYPNHKWIRGQERMPDNWYRRTSTNQYNAVSGVFGDLGVEFLAYPDSFRFGGNTKGRNTYVGIDINNFTNGVYNVGNLFQGNNLACFFFENQQQAVPDQLKGGVNDLASALALFTKFTSAFADLGCKPLSKYDSSVFNKYPGRTYSPTGPATNY